MKFECFQRVKYLYARLPSLSIVLKQYSSKAMGEGRRHFVLVFPSKITASLCYGAFCIPYCLFHFAV